jgi:Enoyl-CoA hydratase/isomerase
VSQVLPEEELVDKALAMADTIASYSQPIAAICKEAVNQSQELGLTSGLAFERRLFQSTFATVGLVLVVPCRWSWYSLLCLSLSLSLPIVDLSLLCVLLPPLFSHNGIFAILSVYPSLAVHRRTSSKV